MDQGRQRIGDRLGDLEAAVMDDLWRRDSSATVREVLDGLQRERPLAYTTVMTVMSNLHRKGWLNRELDGRAWRYQPVADRHEYTATLLERALATSDDQEGALLRFVERMSENEANALAAALRHVTDDRTE